MTTNHEVPPEFEFYSLLDRLRPYCTSEQIHTGQSRNGVRITFTTSGALNIFRYHVPPVEREIFNEILYNILIKASPAIVEENLVKTCKAFLKSFCDAEPRFTLN